MGSLPTPAPAADQQRKALEGWPSKCLTGRAIEKDPTQREPFKCLMHGATEKGKPNTLTHRQTPERTLMGPQLIGLRFPVSLHTWSREGPHYPSSCTTSMLNPN